MRPHEKLKQVKEAHLKLEEAYRVRQRALKARKRKPTSGSLDDVKRALQRHASSIQAIQRGLQPTAQPSGRLAGPIPASPAANMQGRTTQSPANSTRLVITSAGLQSPAPNSHTSSGAPGSTPVTYSHSFVASSPQGATATSRTVQSGQYSTTSTPNQATTGATPQTVQSLPAGTSPGAFQRLSGSHVQIRPAAAATTVTGLQQPLTPAQQQALVQRLSQAQAAGLIQPALRPPLPTSVPPQSAVALGTSGTQSSTSVPPGAVQHISPAMLLSSSIQQQQQQQQQQQSQSHNSSAAQQ